MSTAAPVGPPPSPEDATTLEALIIRLDALRDWAGVPLRALRVQVDALRRARGVPDEPGRQPSYGAVQALFKAERTRLNEALLLDVVRVLLDRQAPSEEWREKQVSAWRTAHQTVAGRPVETDHGREFRLGPLSTPCRILEGDGERAIAEENVRVIVNPMDVRVPDEVAQWRRQIAAEQGRRRQAGEQHLWNAKRYAVENFVISRFGPAEHPEVTLHLKHSDYFTFLAAQQLDRTWGDGATLRTSFLHGRDPRDVPDFMRSSFGLNVALVTADDWLVVSHRADHLAVGRNQWNSTANEGLQRDLDSPDGSPPNLFRAAARGVSEELRLDPDQYDLRLLAFAVVTSLSQWCALFLARLSRMTRQEFEDNAGRGIPDGWEHRRFDYVRFTPEDTVEYLVRRDSWAPAAPVLFYLSLVNSYGRRRVDSVVSGLADQAAKPPGTSS